MKLIHLGDLELTVPLAAAACAWLLGAKEWRAVAAWSVLYAGAIALVGASKIAYLGWGTMLDPIAFKAFSGHAAGVTAVYPVLGYLLCRPIGRGAAFAAASTGLTLGLILAAVLVGRAEHTAAEAVAGWMLGACASIGTVYLLEPRGIVPGPASAACAVAVFVASAQLMQSAHVGYWMVKLALALSGNAQPYSWDTC